MDMYNLRRDTRMLISILVYMLHTSARRLITLSRTHHLKLIGTEGAIKRIPQELCSPQSRLTPSAAHQSS
ncbi:uncharacterized protein PGTG_16920 [Puccinia graminis f. sp. tritici CRL 75-36-700-3]|uniref:Uncharacterized protein n=1 Tax=Puccinia graminis f. sp. tritici (strain CRL 75-36-700-3 / race SCCL) TaxID=418459 RepID=E3L3Q0_PUCGT|nr:uncharacterized protein PGTG_16920 [Puccinia graminis f. sp. tritici CRL 75-36-700-3]EFP91175.1 hypothetical protein PGTG_16920 [Puccinia graminis f. sp. tritici CRL 75-36-700-3]